jgi:hypothetical protein
MPRQSPCLDSVPCWIGILCLIMAAVLCSTARGPILRDCASGRTSCRRAPSASSCPAVGADCWWLQCCTSAQPAPWALSAPLRQQCLPSDPTFSDGVNLDPKRRILKRGNSVLPPFTTQLLTLLHSTMALPTRFTPRNLTGRFILVRLPPLLLILHSFLSR